MEPILVMTGRAASFPSDRRQILLGEWCRPKNTPSVSSDVRIVPYHWDDRAQLHRDYLYSKRIYEKTMKSLAQVLNHVHHTDHTDRYWKIFSGIWLSYYVSILLDRYRSIETAAKTFPGVATTVCTGDEAEPPSPNFLEFLHGCLSDRYNSKLYSAILRSTAHLPFEEICTFTEPNARKIFRLAPAAWRDSAMSAMELARKLFSRRSRIVLASSYFPKPLLAWLQFRLMEFPILDATARVQLNAKVDEGFRQLFRSEMSREIPSDPFEALVLKTLGDNLPLCYLEGYSELGEVIKKKYPVEPRVILSGTSHIDNDAFKLWLATCVERGAKFAVIQHGGHFGTGWCQVEDFEMDTCDRYYSWGWTENDKTHPMPAPKLLGLRRGLKSKPTGEILLVLNTVGMYSHRLMSAMMASQVLSFLDDQRRFIGALSPEVYPHLRVRFHPIDYGWNDETRLKRWFPDLKTTCGGISFRDQLKQCRLYVGTHNTTSFIECMVANYPTVLYWDPRFWELRESVLPFFDQLKKAGIFFETPEAAAAQVNRIASDPLSWWRSGAVQLARRHFCDRFGKTEKEWSRMWRSEIVRLADESCS